jgi:hypothetical protein
MHWTEPFLSSSNWSPSSSLCCCLVATCIQ